MKRLYILMMALLVMGTAWSQTTTWTNGLGNSRWDQAGNWSNGVPVANGSVIITSNTSATIINVAAGGSITLGSLSVDGNSNVTFQNASNNRTLSIGNGISGADLFIESGSSLTLSGASGGNGVNLGMVDNSFGTTTATISGTLTVESGRTFDANNTNTTTTVNGVIENAGTVTGTTTRLLFTSTAIYLHTQNGGAVPDGGWNVASTCSIEGVTANIPTNLDQTFGNFTWNSAGQTGEAIFPTTFTTVNGNLTINTTNIGSLAFANGSNLAIGGDLIINAGNFNLSRFNLPSTIGTRTLNIAGSVIQNGGVFDLDAGTAQDGDHDIFVGGNWTRNGGTFDADAGNVTFDGSAQTISGVSTTFNNLFISSSTATTLGVNISIKSNLTVTTGDVFVMSTLTCNRITTGGTLTVSGTLRLAGDAGGQTGSNFPTNFNTYTLGGTVEYNGDNSLTQTIFAATYQNLILTNGAGSGVSDKVSTASLTVNNNFTVNANTVFTPAAANVISGTTNTISGAGTIKVTRTTGTPSYRNQYGFSTNTLNTMTVDYAGTGNQSIDNFTYGSLLTSGSGTKTLITGNSTVNDVLGVGANTTLTPSNLTINVSTSAINIDGVLDFSNENGSITTTGGGTNVLTMGTNGVIRTVDALGIGPVANASFIQGTGTFTMTSISTAGTVEYYRSATSGQAVTDRDYNNLTITNAGQTKTWTLGATRTVNGDVLINTAALFTLSGAQTINVKGAWQNNSASVATGTSTINFNGTAAQTISGTAVTVFNNLSIANGAGVTLTQNETVNAVLTLTNGVVTTTPTTAVLTMNTGATVPAGGSNASYINGPMTKIGTAAFTFPVGKLAAGTGWVPISIGAAVGSNTFTAEYRRGVPPNSTSIAGAAGINQISACDYWSLNRSAGSSPVTITGNWNSNNPCSGVPYITNPTTIRLVHYNGTSTWDAASTTPGTGLAGTGTVTWTPAINTFAASNTFFALGSTVGTENPLPVLFADVKAYAKNNGVQVEWSNLTERDLSYYAVERSANGVDFYMIEKYLPKSNQDDKASYTHFDAAPIAGINYYRIKVYEKNGKIIYSKVLRVDLGTSKTGLSLYPNPVTGSQLTVNLTGVRQGQYILRVVNANGQQVYSSNLTAVGTGISQMISLPASMKPGVYSAVVSGPDFQENKMFIVR